jgi:hypothetical protein
LTIFGIFEGGNGQFFDIRESWKRSPGPNHLYLINFSD